MKNRNQENFGELNLRDYFAAKALDGFLSGDIASKDGQFKTMVRRFPNKSMAQALAALSYEYADAMLEARKNDSVG